MDKRNTGRSGAATAAIARGFTLIELLVIVAIIGLLIAIGGSTAVSARRTAMRAASIAMLRTLDVGLATYKEDHGVFPESRWVGFATGNQYAGDWDGSQCLVQAMLGYLPAESESDGWLDRNDGDGFRLLTRGRVYGPYVPGDKMATRKIDSTEDPPVERPVFVDSFRNPVLYYKFDRYDSEGNIDEENGDWEYSPDHNFHEGADGPTNINTYVKRGGGSDKDYLRRDYVLCTRGHNKRWWTSSGGGDDDCTNFLGD